MSQQNIFPAESWVASIADKHFRAFTSPASFTDTVCKRDRSNAALFANDGMILLIAKGFTWRQRLFQETASRNTLRRLRSLHFLNKRQELFCKT